MKLSIIIPVYNEEANIGQVLADVLQAPVKISFEIIVVDDGSKDKTRHILEKFKKYRNIKIIHQPRNGGKGLAIRRGIKEVTGDFTLIQDADIEYFVQDYPKILKPLLAGQAKVIYGSRFLGSIKGMNWKNWLANKFLTFTSNILYDTNITDEATAYKAFESKLLKKIPLQCQKFEFCPEITAKIAKKGYKIYEVPINYRARTTREGKKINAKDGFRALWTLIKYRFKD